MALIIKSLVAVFSLPSALYLFKALLGSACCQIPKLKPYISGFCYSGTPCSGTDFCFHCHVLNNLKLLIKTQHQLLIFMILGVHSLGFLKAWKLHSILCSKRRVLRVTKKCLSSQGLNSEVPECPFCSILLVQALTSLDGIQEG